MTRRRSREGALLILLGGIAMAGVSVLESGTPLRIVAGAGLLLVLPWLAASRLATIRASDVEGGRISAAGALTLASLILLGLLLSINDAGITTMGIAAGMLVVVTVLAAIGVPAAKRPRQISARTLLGLALTALALAITVFAFVLARDRALTQAHGESSYAAFLLPNGKGMNVGLINPTGRGARFLVRNVDSGREIATWIPPKSSREIKRFAAQPPPLRPEQRLIPKAAPPLRIRVAIKRSGRRIGPFLELSTYAR
jgi:hypothetical protein